jgi:cytochrome P450 family 4
LATTGQKWHAHRKIITPTFHFSILDSFVEVFSEKSKILISKLQKEVGSQGFDVYPYITKCALDIICGKLFTRICFIHFPTEM